MRKFIIFISTIAVYYLSTLFAVAQTPEIDSLKSLLSQATDYEQRLDLIHQVTAKASFANLDTAEYYATKLLQLSQASDPGNYEAKAYHALGDVARRRAESDKAMEYIKMAMALTTDSLFKIKVYNALGNVHYSIDQYDMAIPLYHKAIALAQEYNSPTDIYLNYNNLSMQYFRQGEYTDALEMNFKALKVIDSLDLDIRTGSIYGVIGVIYQNMDEYDLAFEYYDKAIEADSLFGDQMGVVTWKINWAIALERIDQYYESEQLYFASLADTRRFGFPRLSSNVLSNLGALYKKKGDLPKAIATFEEGLVIADSIGANNLIAFDVQNLGTLYLEANNPRSARTYLMRGRELAYGLKDPAFIRDIHDALSDYFERIGRYDSALYHHRLFMAQKDSILGESKLKEIGKLEAQYDYDKQKIIDDKENEKQLELAEEARKRQMVVLIIVIISALIIAALLVVIYRRLALTRKQKKIIEAQKVEVEAQSQKLQGLDIAKSNFFANISHDLRSPLTLILGSIDQVLEEDDALDEKSRSLLQGGYRNSKKLLFMTDEIRDLSRLQEGKLELKRQYVRIEGYLNLLVKMFSSAATLKNIGLKYESELSKAEVVYIDPHQFEKVIYNLLSNAVRHTPAYGDIAVVLKEDSTQADHLLIEVRDTGVGIPQDLTPHIFDRYYQVPSPLPGETVGLGIGLALCQEIVELHGATISVESAEGDGACFKVSLKHETVSVGETIIVDEYYDPVYSPLEYIQEEENTKESDKKSTTILIVEDHREIRQYMSNLLRDDHHVVVAKNGQEALEKLKSEKISLVVSDLMMPYMDGFELIKNLKMQENFRHLPILIVSARTNEEDKLEILKLGADAIIAKPFSPGELRLRIQNMLTKATDNKILELFEPSNVMSGVENMISQKLEKLILSRISDSHLSVMDLSEELAASERKVFRLVKKIFNLTPLELIKETRWKYLETLLRNGKEMSATEAARTIGFSNVTYFKRQYADRFGKEYGEGLD